MFAIPVFTKNMIIKSHQKIRFIQLSYSVSRLGAAQKYKKPSRLSVPARSCVMSFIQSGNEVAVTPNAINTKLIDKVDRKP